ncbi:MAG: DUF4349 domain-containing protein [Propionibacteriaceae bacterium]|nr:DUF4349 domain-containing protein [Propionibacteriaceae bacterium]
MKRTGWMGRVTAIIAALLMTALMASCSASGGDMAMPTSGELFPMQENDSTVQGDMALPQEDGVEGDGERLIIRSKVLRLEVDSTTDTMDEIRELTRANSGTVSDLQVATDSEDWLYRNDRNGTPLGDGTALRGWVTVRVPAKDYESFVAGVAKLGVVKFQSEATSDVTQEYVDLSARLENLRAQEVRLRDFFDAAKDVKDMLAIETELGRVRGDIESLDAQVTLLERQAAMATVTVELTEPRAVVRPDGESWGFVDAITSGVRGASQLLAGLLTFVIATSPLWILGLVLFFPIRALVRRRRQRAERTHVTNSTLSQAAWPLPTSAGPGESATEPAPVAETTTETETTTQQPE